MSFFTHDPVGKRLLNLSAVRSALHAVRSAAHTVSVDRSRYYGFALGALMLTGIPLVGRMTLRPRIFGVHGIAHTDSVPPDSEYVNTPAGRYHRSCVHEIAKFSHVNRDGRVTHPDGSSEQLPICRYPIFDALGAGTFAPPTDSGWMEFAEVLPTTGYNFHDITAVMKVPFAPATTYSTGGKVFYEFPGLEPFNGQNILQPVLQYGNNGYFGGAYFTMAAWTCGTGTPWGCVYSTPDSVATGDSIVGSIDAQSTTGGTNWAIQMNDVTRSLTTGHTWKDTLMYGQAFGGVVEVYNLTTCDEFPERPYYGGGNAYPFLAIAIDQYYNPYGTTYAGSATGSALSTPTWTTYVDSSASPSCNFVVHPDTTAVFLSQTYFRLIP
jgi:hypothetical protein